MLCNVVQNEYQAHNSIQQPTLFQEQDCPSIVNDPCRIVGVGGIKALRDDKLAAPCAADYQWIMEVSGSGST